MKNKRLNYQIIGSDSPSKLVFLHGILGRGRNWQAIAKSLSREHQCLLFDQRGHGQSFQPERGYELKDYASDLRNLLSDLGWMDSVQLVGHSMGGRVALEFSHLWPDWVQRLCIVDIGPSSDWRSMSSILEKIEFVPVPFKSREEARRFMEQEFLARFPDPMVMEFFYSNLQKVNDSYDWVFSKQGVRQTLENSRHRDHWATFKELACPTLLIRGEQSTDLKKEDFEKVLANNQSIQGHVVSGAGHWVHAEKPQETLSLLRQFFNIART